MTILKTYKIEIVSGETYFYDSTLTAEELYRYLRGRIYGEKIAWIGI